MKIDHTFCSNRPCLALLALVLAAAPALGVRAAGTPTTTTIRYTGTDFEGRQNFQLEWNADSSGNYLVQSADVLSASNNWQTVDSVTASNAGPVKWMAPEVLRSQKFYRLVLPQPQIFSVEPAVVDVTVSNTPLYILGQCLPTNALVLINGLYFTPTLVNTGGVWAVVSLNGLPPGEPWFGLSVVDAGTSNVIATLPNSVLGVDTSSPYLLEPPEAPPASPATKEVHAVESIELQFEEWKMSARVSGNGGAGGGNPDAIPAAKGNIAAALNGNTVIGELRRGTDRGPRNLEIELSPTIGGGGDGDPRVIPSSGEVQQQVADLAIAGRGLDFVWARTYRSRTTDADNAFGLHWTCSYDVRLQPLGGDIVIHDGTGRADTYYLQTNGTYICPGFFREGTLSNNVFRLTFADGGIWVFNPLDGTATAGLLANIMTGDGNVIKLYRNGAGRVSQIVDDLGRTNSVAYNSDGYVQSITDFSGRTVSYAYYQMGEIGGSVGDLKSVTSPPVTGTPNGNDFPDGKTTTYTYSTGYLDDRENHLLLSVIDANGQTTRQYVYQHNQTDFDFLRCISVQRGTDKMERITVLPQIAAPANRFAVVRCIVNDPEGNVAEYFYDARNRCVMERDYTGRATPEVPVTDTVNRPTGKLRPSDPDYYETQWTWNNDSLCTSETSPGGQQIQCAFQSDFDPATPARKRADLRVRRELAAGGVDLDGDGVADATERVWRFEYDPRFGTGEGTARLYNPGKSYLVGDTAIYNGSVWQKVDNTDSLIINMRDRINALENHLKSLGLLARTGNVGINEPLPYATLHAAASGKRFGIGDTTPQGPLGWDGTLQAEVRQNIEELHADLFADTRSESAKVITDRESGRSKGFGFVISSTDSRGNVTTASYDAQGNLTSWEPHKSSGLDSPELEFTYNSHGQLTALTNAPDANGYRRVDTINYYTSGPQAGYLQSIAIDEPGVHLTTSYETDARGNVTRCVDPRGNDWLYTFNALDQCVRCESPTNLTARCATDFFYDAADNVQAAIVEVRDDMDTKVASKTVIRGYDRLHRLTRITCDADATHAMTNDFVYDGNDRCVLALGGDAVSGADPHQAVAYEYDERGLLFREITAPGSPLAGTNEFSYTADYHPATKKYVDSGDSARISTFTYDGFNRLASVTDPMGNQMVFFFDANDNLKTVRCFGETNDVPGSVGNLRLAETRYDYDGQDRCVRVHELHFNPATQAPVGDGDATTSFAYAPDSEYVSRTNDLGHVTTYGYDTAGRLTSVTSPNARTTFAILRDRNGNATNCSETDLSDLGGAPQVFSVASVYDSQNRCVQSVDNAGNTNAWAYDSLGRCVRTVDPRGTHAFYAYDLLGRCTVAVGDLDGDGFPDFTGDITGKATWSSSSERLLSLTDSHTNTTSYAYDTLGNCTNVSYADGTRTKLVWSPRSNLVNEEDANGSVVSNTYDLNNRIIHRDLAARTAVGVAATTTFETYTYDGCSRLTSHHDDDCDGYLAYDSLGHCIHESLNGLTTTSTYDAVGNRLSLAYPGGRLLNFTYDALERCIGVAESGKSQASYSYDGPGRVSRVALGNNTVTRIFYDGISGQPNSPGDHGWQEITRVAHGLNGGSAFADSSFQYDSDQNKISRAVIIPGGTPHTNAMSLQYDLACRLTESFVTDNSALSRDTVYGLDRMGNRTHVTGAACSGDYTLDGLLLGPLDFQMNQYTTTPCESRTYDDNGNLVSRSSSAGALSYIYDAADRLVAVQTVDYSSGVPTLLPVADYRYDALGRRISSTVYSGSTSNVTQFLYDGDRVIEERLDGAVSVSYLVDDRYLLGLRTNGKDYYRHCDDQGNALALTDAQGAVVERYEYDDYGAVTFLASDGTPTSATSSAYGNVYLFGGLRYDAESGLDCDDGGSYLEPQSGRYMCDYMNNPMKSARMSIAVSGLADNNPWSGSGGGGGGAGGSFAERNRDYLYEKFQDGDIPTGDDRIIPRNVLKSYFETGDKPTQEQFSSLIDSAVNLNLQPLGGGLPIHGKVSRAILKTYFLTGKIPTQD
jgi:YD repeat-containing protein